MLKFLMWNTATEERKLSDFSVPDFRSGSVAVPDGATQVTVNYSSALTNPNDYVVTAQWVNKVDTYPQIQPTYIKNETASGFVISWNSPTDTGNYRINWFCIVKS